MDNTNMSNISDIFKLIEDAKHENVYNTYVPSLDTEIAFLPLNANHQKQLLKSLVDNPYFSTYFNLAIFSILNEICISAIDINKLNILDKQFILLAIRANNIGEEFELEKTDSNNETFKKKIDLFKLLAKKNRIKQLAPKVIEVDSYKATLNYPTLLKEFTFEKLVSNELSKINEENTKAMKNMISYLFIINILQYITDLTIKDNFINFEELEITNQIKIGSQLPSKLINAIISEIDTYFGAKIREVLHYEFVKDGEKYEGELTLDNVFFMSQ